MNWDKPPKIVNGKYEFSLKDRLAIWWENMVLVVIAPFIMFYSLCVSGLLVFITWWERLTSP